jgi:hypothetical protein
VSELGLIYRNIELKIEFGSNRSTEMEVEHMFAQLLNEMQAAREEMDTRKKATLP